MYYLYSDSGELIDSFGADELEAAKACKFSIAGSILIYWDGATINNDTPWELGIELYPEEKEAPTPNHFFEYEIMFENGSVLEQRQKTLEDCIEDIKHRLEKHPGAQLWGEIDEITRITHRVKI